LFRFDRIAENWQNLRKINTTQFLQWQSNIHVEPSNHSVHPFCESSLRSSRSDSHSRHVDFGVKLFMPTRWTSKFYSNNVWRKWINDI
jgi:hypothetical protein